MNDLVDEPLVRQLTPEELGAAAAASVLPPAKRCGNCLYRGEVRPAPGAPITGLICRRYPPVPFAIPKQAPASVLRPGQAQLSFHVESMWPPVGPEWNCGEWDAEAA